MTDEFKALTIGDLKRISERLVAEGRADNDVSADRQTFEVLAQGIEIGWGGDIDAVYRIAREILAERTSSEALKRAARVEELDRAPGPGPYRMVAGDLECEHGDHPLTCAACPAPIDPSEFRILAPALAADVRAYDAALRELVEALDERTRAVPEAEAKVDALRREQENHWNNAQDARDKLDYKEYQRHIDMRHAINDQLNAARKDRDETLDHAEARVAHAIEAARKVLG